MASPCSSSSRTCAQRSRSPTAPTCSTTAASCSPAPLPSSRKTRPALAPTDPVFASAIIGREEVPGRLRHLLNVESGLNDGLALPFVVAFIAWEGERDIEPASIVWQLALGVALGIVVPWIAVRLEKSRFFAASKQYRPIGVFSVGL